jgi:type I restriction enzyme M protein
MGDKNSNKDSILLQNIHRGQQKGIISLSDDNSKITYFCSREYTTSFKNPEEKIRASYFIELVEDYNYPKENINIEHPVPRRTPEDRADIVVFEDNALKKPYLVVECKKDGISDAEFKQAIEQVFGNANSLRAKFASVIAGTTRTAFDIAGFTAEEREKNVISDIPLRYGRTPKYRFVKGDQDKELKIVQKEDLIRTLEKAHDTVWQGGRLAPTTAFDEISKLLFCKLYDEKESSVTKKGEPYKFQIGTYETADEVFIRIDNIYKAAKQKDSEVFKDDIRLEPKIVYSVVEHLQSINFNKTDLDTKGIAFERFMEDFFRGKMGQFFTPRELIRFSVRMLNPQTNEILLDPACGSGGFLLNAMDLIREQAEKEHDDDPVAAYRVWHDFAKDNIYGIDINDQIARVCKMNMILHDDGHTNVISIDSLTDMQEIIRIHKKFAENTFDLILTNPPFGAIVKQSEKPYLQKYSLSKGKKNQKTEILFIERCLEFLRPGTGRMGIVLPDGILTNSSLQYVRDFIMERTQILAVVSLPQFAFAHFGAGVKSSLVFLRKKAKGEKSENYPIFMAIAEHIGYDATGRKIPQNDLDRIVEEYRKFASAPSTYQGC